jgi:glucoside 3-dehydrogenase (cytochrome c) hitch-hiker subunit
MDMPTDTDPLRPVNRREVVHCVAALLGGTALAGGRGLLYACERAVPLQEATLGEFTAEDIAFLDEIAETILPATSTPGAKAAKTGAFMALMVTDSYSAPERKIFRDGMRKVDGAIQQANGVPFLQATPPQRLDLLTALDREQKAVMDSRKAAMDARDAAASIEHPAPAHYFRMMKELALLGYFTSKVGCTQALRYVESPGRFDPCIPYAPGEPAWAAHA